MVKGDRWSLGRKFAGGGFHHDGERLGFRGGARAIEIGSAANALYIPVRIHLAAGGAAHAFGGGAILPGQPATQNSRVDREGEHLSEVCFDESVRAVDDIVKEAVGSLIGKATIDDIGDENGETLAVVFTADRKGTDDAGESGGGPAIAATPVFFLIFRVGCIVPEMSQQFFLGIPQAFAETIDLLQGLVVVTCGREEGRSAIEPVGPDLGMIEDVVERAVGGAWGFAEDPIEEPACCLLNSGIACDLPCMPVCCATHGGIGRASFDNHAEAAIRHTLDNCGLGQANDVVVFSGFEEGLSQSALLPIAALHSQPGKGGFLNAFASVCRLIESGGAWKIRKAQSRTEKGHVSE